MLLGPDRTMLDRDRAPVDVVVAATPVDLARLVSRDKPVVLRDTGSRRRENRGCGT
jgi:hypothetical protein